MVGKYSYQTHLRLVEHGQNTLPVFGQKSAKNLSPHIARAKPHYLRRRVTEGSLLEINVFGYDNQIVLSGILPYGVVVPVVRCRFKFGLLPVP